MQFKDKLSKINLIIIHHVPNFKWVQDTFAKIYLRIKIKMLRTNILLILIVISLISLSSCEKKENEVPDNLEKFGILGNWRLQALTINGITDMIVHYDTLEFTTGNNIDDQKGDFRRVGSGYETIGQFEIDTDSTILFSYNSKQRLYNFRISNNALTFDYFDEGVEYIEDWSKVE